MAEAVIHITLDNETVERIAQRTAALVSGGSVAQSNPPAPEPQAAWSGQAAPQQAVAPQQGGWGQPDPTQQQWTAPPAQTAPSAPPAPAPAQHSAPTASPVANAAPFCNHGQMRYVNGGIIKSGPRAGQAYPPFYGCAADRNAPDKCKSVSIT